MGYCVNCGAPTEGNTPVCSSCASLNSANNGSNQQSPFNQAEGNLNRYDNVVSLTKTKPQRDYWKAMLDNPSIAYEQLFKEGEPENDFDLGDIKKKFNIGACFFTTTWLAFNCNIWCAVIFWFALLVVSAIPIVNFLMFPVSIALMVYFGIKGNEIAWKTRPYKNLEHFKKNQKIWAWAVPISFILVVVLAVVCSVVFGAMFMGAMR